MTSVFFTLSFCSHAPMQTLYNTETLVPVSLLQSVSSSEAEVCSWVATLPMYTQPPCVGLLCCPVTMGLLCGSFKGVACSLPVMFTSLTRMV